jgi:hypothetical protein
MIRLICATNHCTHQAAELCHMRQREAALRAELAERDDTIARLTAERDVLAAQVVQAQDAAQGALEGKLFYEDMYCQLSKEAARCLGK